LPFNRLFISRHAHADLRELTRGWLVRREGSAVRLGTFAWPGVAAPLLRTKLGERVAIIVD
jgi:hypothetical protein